MGKKKGFSKHRMEWLDFCRLIRDLEKPPLDSYEIVNSSGRVLVSLIGENEVMQEASSNEDVEKFLEKHAVDFKKAKTLIAKLGKSKKLLRQTKKELAEEKRRKAKFREVTEKVKERVYGKSYKRAPDVLFENANMLEKKLASQRRRDSLIDKKTREDFSDVRDARKALKDKKPSIPFEKLRYEMKKNDEKRKKRSNKKG